ncbi:MAG: ATPase domain-containing protein [Candidatus Woesearchaeota archaeon]
MKIVRVSSGIPGLDKLVQSGFKKNSMNLIAGEPGAGKTIFGIQFLVEGCRKGEAGVYITFEEKKQKLYENMATFGWDLEKYEKQGLFRFLEYTPEQVKKLLVEGGGVVDALVEKIKAKRIVIDSISSFSLLYEDELTKKEAALSLFDLIEKWNCTAVLTSQSLSADHESIIDAALEFEVDSIIILYHSKKQGERVRAMEILKMRGTKIPSKTFGLKFSDEGISITSDTVKL